MAASDAARLALRAARASEAAPTEALAADLTAAFEAFDDTSAQALLDRTLSLLSLEAAVRDVFLPALADVARGWEDDEAVIAREHFASNLVRGRLLGLARGWDLGGALGGPGATAELAERVGGELLAGDPFAAAAEAG